MEKVDSYSWMVGIMNSKDERIIQKLKAIIDDTPYPGEREAALNVLERYCLAHNISEEDLDNSIEEQIFSYDIPRGENYEWAQLLRCVTYYYFERKGKSFKGRSELYEYRAKKLRNLLRMEFKCYPAEFIEIIAEYEVYAAAFKKQLNAFLKKKHKEFLRAFLDKNDLLLPPDYFKLIGKLDMGEVVHQFWESASYELALEEASRVSTHKQLSLKEK